MIQLTTKEKKLLFISLVIPVLFTFLAFINRLAEYYFRLSTKYHFIYSWVSTTSLFVQMGLVLVSMIFGIYFVDQRKRFKSRLSIPWVLLSSGVFLHFLIALIIILFEVSSS